MTAHSREWSQLRVGCTVTLRDWRGDTVTGKAFLSPAGEWLMRMSSGSVFPILPRELIHVDYGAEAMFARLQEGARVTFADWEGATVAGIAHRIPAGIWECKDANGARWYLEPYRILTIEVAPCTS